MKHSRGNAVAALITLALTACGSDDNNGTAAGDDGGNATYGDGSFNNPSNPDGGGVVTPGADGTAPPPGQDGSSPPPGQDGSSPPPVVDAGPPFDSGPVAQSDAGANGQWVMGYYTGYNTGLLPIANIDWSGLTHIIFGPVTVNSATSLNMTFEDSNGTADAKALATAAHAHGVKALMMLGGQNSGAPIKAATTSGNVATFVSTLIADMKSVGFDGIDLDWEDNVSLPQFIALVQGLRAAQPNIILTLPGGSLNLNSDHVDPQWVTVAQSLDRYNIQTYYPSTAYAGTGSGWYSWFSSPLSGNSGHTPTAIDAVMAAYATAGIPKSKIGMGVAFYAICYTGNVSAPLQSTDGSSIVGGDNAFPLSALFSGTGTYAKNTASAHVDATAKVPYLSLASAVTESHCGGQSTRYITWDDETSLIAKGTFSKANGYGGIIIWTINQGWLPTGAAGGRAQNSLFQALRTGFIQ
jgi:chitinase